MSAVAVADPSREGLTGVRAPARRITPGILIVVALTVLAATLRFAGIGHQSLWYDESFTATLVRHPVGQMLGLLPRTELTPPLYYLVAWVWTRVFGFGAVGLRSLSALAGVATVPAIYAAGRTLVSERAGLIAAALACCNPLLIWYSQEARSYSLLTLLATLSLVAFAYVRKPHPSWRQLGAWAVAAGLTLATHYYAVLIVVPEALWLLWVHRRDRRVLLAIAAVAAFGLALLPIAISQRPNASWIATWPLDQRLSQIAPQYLLGTGAPARTWLKLGGALAVLLAAVLLVWRADPRERGGALVAGALGVMGFLLSLGLIVAGVDELITRNVILVLIPLLLLIAGGLGARRAGLLGVIGAVTLCAIGLTAAIAVAEDWRLQRPDWQAVATAIGAGRPTPRAGRAIIIQDFTKLLPLAAYVPRLRFMAPHGERVREFDVIAATHPTSDRAYFCWWGSVCNLVNSRLDPALRIRGFHRDGPVLFIDDFRILRLRSATPIRLTAGEVQRALAATPPIPRYHLLMQPSGPSRRRGTL